MSDRYQELVHNPLGQVLVKNLGLPNPPYLERWHQGRPVVDGTVLIGQTPDSVLGSTLTDTLRASGVTTTNVPSDDRRYKALVFDATGCGNTHDLTALTEFFTPRLRSMESCGRVLVIGTVPEEAENQSRVIAQRALEGFVRSLGKEVGAGTTANLVYVSGGTEDQLASSLEFFLSPKSAYVSGQVARLRSDSLSDATRDREIVANAPLSGKIALVTGAARGLGAADVQVLARDGARVIGVDVPAMGDELETTMSAVGGESLTMDIAADDAPAELAAYIKEHHGGVDILVHNAGVTRDKRLKNMKAENFGLVIDISVGAPERITAELLDQDLIRTGGRIIGISSIAGIAGNNGQTNYGAAKAGVIGFIADLSRRLADRGITANVVAPGFIETDMIKSIPFATREAGRRMNSMSQGGLPVDVAETIAWYADPRSQAVTGNVVRVCGQSLLGA